MGNIEEKTTILLTRNLKRRLARLSNMTGKSMGRLLREAAERLYFSAPIDEKRAIVRKMASMQIPVGSPSDIAEEIARGRMGG